MTDVIVDARERQYVVYTNGLALLAPFANAAQDALDRINEFTTGPAGPAGNVANTLAVLKAAPITNRTMIAAYRGGVPFNWETANAPYVANDLDVVKANSTALSVGAWVQQAAETVRTANKLSVQQNFDDLTFNALSAIPSSMRDAVKGSTVSSDTIGYMRDAVNDAVAKGFKVVKFPRGLWTQSDLLTVPSNIGIEGDGRSTVFKVLNAIPTDSSIPGGSHQGQNVALKSGSSMRRIRIDGNGIGGGVVCAGISDFELEQVAFRNGLANQSFQVIGCSDFQMKDCSSERNLFATQLWASTDFRVDNFTANLHEAGVFVAGSTRGHVFNAKVMNCSDVCMDLEGGQDCKIEGGYARGGKNGELSIFTDGTGNNLMDGLEITGVQVRRTAQYVDRVLGVQNTDTTKGAIFIANLLTASSGKVDIHHNTITVEAAAGLCWLAQGDYASIKNMKIRDNEFVYRGAGPLFDIPAKISGIQHDRNKYRLEAAIATTATYKNATGGSFSGNAFHALVAPTVPVVTMYTDQAQALGPCEVKDNSFRGTGQFAMKFDAFVAGPGAWRAAGNSFSDTPQPNGGITVTLNGGPTWIDQVIRYPLTAATNLTNVEAIKDGKSVVTGEIVIRAGGVMRNQYRFWGYQGFIASANGSGSASGVSQSTADFVTFAGSAITPTFATTSGNASSLRLTINTAE